MKTIAATKTPLLKSIILSLVLAITALFTSCSGDDYLNAIPAESTALMSIDMPKVSGGSKGIAGENIMKAVFHVSDFSDCGIDMSSKIYLFESPDGNLGMAAKVKSEDDIARWMGKLAKHGVCQKLKERRGTQFTVIGDSWVTAFNGTTMLVMGPVLSAEQPTMMRQMMKYLEADEGIKGTPIYDKLDSIDAPMAMVAKVSALPEKLSPLLTLGVPADADPSRVLFSAGMKVEKGCLKIDGKTFSYIADTEKALQKSMSTFRPIGGRYTQSIAKDNSLVLFMNADGSRLIDILHANKGLEALLAGMNTAIDMDNIIRCVDGDMALGINGFGSDSPEIQMAAQLGKRDFLKDVGYWKQSCPAGSKITDWEQDAYCYSSNSMAYYFGVSDDSQFFSGSTPEKAHASIVSQTEASLPQAVTDNIKGKRICVLVSVSSLMGGDGKAKVAQAILTPLFGKVDNIILTL